VAKGVCHQGVDDHHQVAADDLLLEVVEGDDLEVVVDVLRQEVAGGDLPQAVGDALLHVEVVDDADHLLADVVHCCLLLEEDDRVGSLGRLAGVLNPSSTQPIDPTSRQISFFVCHCTMPEVVENAPD